MLIVFIFPAVFTLRQYSTLMNIAPPEPFVDAVRAAEFLSLRTRRVIELARMGQLPAYPLGAGTRRVWRFRLSELAAALSGMAAGGSSFTSRNR